MDIKSIFEFISFVNKSTIVKRGVVLPSREGFESDGEHCYQLSLLCWYLVDLYQLPLNKELVLEYALCHDLVEAYAGDTDVYKSTAEFLASKRARENEALKNIQAQFENQTNICNLIKEYEEKRNDEARLVYLMDKILPVINTFLAKDNYYIENRVSYEKWKNWLLSKIEEAKFENIEINNFLKQIIIFFEENKKDFFK
ncbi:MAG: HD domain-containing protein [Candidatus Gribaldobacteria bacterium]|nr:HD domain-containing protein [Candidatus Gribaldobacteria bacterium]